MVSTWMRDKNLESLVAAFGLIFVRVQFQRKLPVCLLNVIV